MRRLGDSGTLTGGETSIASAATTNIGASKTRNVAVTGTTTITSFGTVALREALIRFTGALTLTYNATSLILPTLANITTVAGDTCIAVSDASGNWRVVSYDRVDGSLLPKPWMSYTPTASVTSPGATPPTFGTVTGRYQITGKRVDVVIAGGISANGTGAGAVVFSLPVVAQGSSTTLSGRETNATGAMLQGFITGGGATTVSVAKYDNSYPGGTGYGITLSGSYEAQ